MTGIDERSTKVEDDGLPILDVGSWAEDKYRLVALYDELFSTGMKKKWETRVYIDLYSGPGFARVKGTSRLMWGSPLLAMRVPDRFDKCIFCESSTLFIEALQKRSARLFPDVTPSFISGDCNDRIDEICAAIPRPSSSPRVLSFCFLDPFDISTRFATVKRLVSYYVDFLFLLALHMDANRNLASYVAARNSKVDDFLGLPDWREKWEAQKSQVSFPQFLARTYSEQMESLGYLPMPFSKMKSIRSDEKNLPLYHLALFSRHELAYSFWDEVLRYSTDQRSLF